MARRRADEDRFGYRPFPPSRPLEARGGIRAQSTRGDFGSSWWAKRWMSVLQGYGLGARLTRGRSYARGGQVLSIEVGLGHVTAKVQGSRTTPYGVDITVRELNGTAWEAVAKEISSQAVYVAKLLAGEIPEDIEDVFARAGTSLFPSRFADLSTRCSCPDSSNPCKHIAAVFCLLGEEFDRDPFLLLKLRGLDRDGLSGLLGGAGGPRGDGPHAGPEPAPEPLPAEAAAFWSGRALPHDLPAPATQPPEAAPLLRRLGNPPFWTGSTDLLEAVEGAYATASDQAVALLAALGDMGLPPEAPRPAPRPAGAAEPVASTPPTRTARTRTAGAAGATTTATPLTAAKSRERAALKADADPTLPAGVLRAKFDGRTILGTPGRRG